uniref:Uncharacterized protein n=1 Tax=Ditylum brightwellii TaxID=49249 RepID=A0A7S4QH34_9STRA
MAAKAFVPITLLQNTKCPTPSLILLSRDVPAFSKEQMMHRIFSEFPGRFVRINVKENFGLDPHAFQKVLDMGQSIIADIDVGLGASTRSMFLQGISVVKLSLAPTPRCVCIVGDPLNRREHSEKTNIGTAKIDLDLMRDGSMKQKLETLMYLSTLLKGKIIADRMKVIGECESPPSRAYLLLMEAVVVLLSPQSLFRDPQKNIRSISWQGTRRLLLQAERLQGSLVAVNIFEIPGHNLSVLRMYVTHDDWPKVNEIGRRDILLWLLHTWVKTTVSFASELKEAGGMPDTLSTQNPPNLFESVITVRTTFHNENGSGKDDWKFAYNEIVLSFLQETFCYKHTVNIENSEYDVSMHYGHDKIFFFTQDPVNMTMVMGTTDLDKIDSLLAPNSVDLREGKKIPPPETHKDMFSRLSDLIVLHRNGKPGSGVLSIECKRKTNILLRETRRISGHVVFITASEDGTGELRYKIYVPLFSRSIELVVTEQMLFGLLRNADSRFETNQFQSSDAMSLLVPVTDRLKIIPNYKTTLHMVVETAEEAPGILKSAQKITRELMLDLRKKGGPGRELFSCIHKISGMCHVVSVKEIGRDGVLIIHTYNSINSEELIVHLESIDRRLCLGGTNSDWRVWGQELLQRLSLRSKGNSELTLFFDRTFFSDSEENRWAPRHS